MGKPKYIGTAEDMWNLFCEYVKLTKENPRFRTQFVGKDGNMVKEPLERPLTLEGFELFVSDKGIISNLSHYFINLDNRYSDYVAICSRIKKTIRRDQIEGGMVGQYNPSITQRLNGLKESTETEIKGTLNIPNLPDIGNRGKK